MELAHQANAPLLERFLHSGNAADYYFVQYAFDGALSLYEAEGDVRWLNWVVTESWDVVQGARPMLDGELGWPWFDGRGRPNEVTGDSILCEFQIGRPMLRAARLAASIPGYPLAAKASDVAAFVLEHIMAKWLDRRMGAAGGQRPSELADEQPWIRVAESRRGWDSTIEKASHPEHPWLDTWSMAGELNTNAYLLTHRSVFRERALVLSALFKKRKRIGQDGAWTWDDGVDVGPWSEHGGNTAGCPDTGHANREVAWVVQGYLAGIGFDRGDVDGLIRTLEARIAQPGRPPRFSNYLCGADTPYRGYTFGGMSAGIASVFDGWVRLSWISPEVEPIFQSLVPARQAGDDSEANFTAWGDLELPGHLALASVLEARGSGQALAQP